MAKHPGMDMADGIPPMDAAELEEIGVRLYGKWGWSVKLAKVLGKDQSTIRRWRGGSPIEPVYAAAIREHDKRVGGASAPSWGGEGGNALAALRLVARAQALAAMGAAVSIRVTGVTDGIRITLGIGSARQMVADSGEGERFEGLAAMNAALDETWGPEGTDTI